MYQLEIQFENEAYLKVLTTKDIESELSEYFKFMSPGHKFDPRVKHGLWDGAIRLYSLKTKTMYRGLLPELIEFCKERGYAYNLQSYQKPDLDLDQIQYIEDHLLDKITLHDYQRSSVLYAAENDRSIIVSPTGSGKSAIIYTLSIFYILNGFKKVLIIVPTTSLVEQMYKDFITYHKGDRREFAETIQRISGEYSKEIDVKSNFVISTWQSIYKFPNEWFNQFDMVLADECVHPKSKITMSDGEKKNIEDIQIGDIVKTFNENTGILENKRVFKVFKNMSKKQQLYKIRTADGKELLLTGNHKVLLDTGVWKRTDELEIDDCINIIKSVSI